MTMRTLLVPVALAVVIGGPSPTLAQGSSSAQLEAIKQRFVGHYELVIYESFRADGDLEGGIWTAGMVAGLIHDIPSCQELVSRIMSEAEDLIAKRIAPAVV